MPNFHVTHFDEPNLPVSFRDSKFEFVAQSRRNEQLIMSYFDNEKLLIKVNRNKNGYLIKGDKITKPTQVAILQQVLQDFRDLIGATPINSNIDHKKIKSLNVSPYLKKIDYFADNFYTSKDILVEVGFGSGRHLLYQANKNPDCLVIGIEIHKPSIEQVLKQCELQNIKNIIIIDYDARVLFEFLASNSVKQIFVHFPVPWDKKPQRRVISKEFIKESKRVLQINGTLELRTDSGKYFEYSFFEFMSANKAKIEVNKNLDLQISSKYEDRWKKQEKNIYDITLINEEDSQDIQKIGKLDFEEKLDFAQVKKRFKPKVSIGEGFFAHIEEIYVINEEEGFIRLSFGSSNRNEHNYIYITKDKVKYFPDNVLATKDNINSHNLIKEYIWNM